MKIAVIGSGISGMAAAHYLSSEHEIYLYEAGSRLGGHTATMDIEHEGEKLAIDTGFIVFNDWTYPNFIGLLNELKVESQPSQMSFSVSDPESGLEYSGSSLNSMFAQRRNLVSPGFLTMIKDILRFNSQAEQHLQDYPELADICLGEYLQKFSYSRSFRDYYLIPMGAAIWSSSNAMMLDFPLAFFVRFFRNHGLLSIKNRPQWRVIKGGSRAYIAPLTKSFQDNIYLDTPVQAVRRNLNYQGIQKVSVNSHRGVEHFDEVIFACHSDQALRILADPSEQETALLSAIPYAKNEVVLHTDTRLLPANKKCWSSWNVNLQRNDHALPSLTYNMNILQGLTSATTYCVTLNQSEGIDREKILGSYEYDHPVFSQTGMQAQENWHTINGVNNTWFCGAYWRNGFHEDGVWSALRVAKRLKEQQQVELAVAV